MSKNEDIEKLNQEIIRCNNCILRKGCKQPVPGGGNLDANIFFLAEACGQNEDDQAKVFVGKSGKLLNAWIIKELGLKRRDVFVSNIVKCRPPNNRDPLPFEIEKCLPYLNRQIEIIKPKIIITLGRVALQALFNDKSLRITRVRGKWREYKGLPLMPVYHPAYLLRQMSDQNKQAVKSDFKKVVKKLEEIVEK